MDNPIKLSRLSSNLTQQSFSELCSVSRQVVLLTEAGCYNLIPSSILTMVTDLSGIPSWVIEGKYRGFQSYTRRHRIVELSPMSGPTYREFRGDSSVAGLCKILCINPNQWTRLETKGGNASFFINAMEDAGRVYGDFARTLSYNK